MWTQRLHFCYAVSTDQTQTLCVRFIYYGVLIGSESCADISAGTEHASTRYRTHNTAVKLVFRLMCRPFFT